MLTLQGKSIYLRALEPEDLDFIYTLENDETIWELSSTQTPYSRYLIKQYLENAHKDIYEVKQLRLLIANENHESIGLIDLFDCDFKNKRAGIGILIYSTSDRQQGYGHEALGLLITYVKKYFDLHQLFCNISEDNKVSLKLFESNGFIKIGLKKDWNYVNGSYKNEYVLQRIFN